jgi:hypothetical protein
MGGRPRRNTDSVSTRSSRHDTGIRRRRKLRRPHRPPGPSRQEGQPARPGRCRSHLPPPGPRPEIGFVFRGAMSRHISHNHIPELRLAQIRPFPNWLCSARFPPSGASRLPQIGFVSHVSLPGRATPHRRTTFAHIPQLSQVWLRLAQIPSVWCLRRDEIGFVSHASIPKLASSDAGGIQAGLLQSAIANPQSRGLRPPNWVRFARFTPRPSHAP